MAIKQNSTITVGSGSDARTFGISKALDQYTLDDLKTVTDWCFSAFEDSLWNANIFDGSFHKTAQVWDTGKAASVHLYKFPSYQMFIEGSQMTGSLFTRNVLIYCNTAVNWAGTNIYHGLSNLNRYHIVTDIDLQDLKLYLGNNPDTVASSIPSCKLGINDVRICPMQLIIDEEDNIYLCLFENWNGARGGAGNRNSQLSMRGISYDNVEIAYYNYNNNNGMRAIDGTKNTVLGPSGIDFALHTASNDEVYTTGTEVKVERTSGGGYNYFSYTLQSANTDLPYLTFAYGGLRFNDGTKDYKPIVENGMITGYTDDDTVQSEWDTWENIKDHVTPSERPLPPDSPITDKEHEMPLAYIGGNAGMVTFYEINKSGLASADDISEAISRFDIAQIGKDLLRNFISFKVFAAISVDDTVDRQIKIAGIPLEDSGGHALTGRVIGGVKPIDLFPTSGGVTIPTLYNDYRDYEPYTKIQMYVPFCGWFSLPSWCIGKKITGTMFTDLYNGTVKAVIYASQTVIAEVGGCCAYDIPFVADATGAKASAVISSALTTAAAVGGTVAMPNVATGIAAVSAAANLAATLNSNDTTLKGVLGDGSNLNGLLHVYIKVSRPMSPNGSTAIPDSYKHEIGIPTMKEITLSAGDGYIQVMDAKVTGTMTAREKQMIVDGFRHGLNF